MYMKSLSSSMSFLLTKGEGDAKQVIPMYYNEDVGHSVRHTCESEPMRNTRIGIYLTRYKDSAVT